MILILKKKKYLVLIILILFSTFNLFSKDYLINFQAKVVNTDKHNYSEGNNFNLLKLDGSFTDNLGNYGNWNALASFELHNNKIKQHFFSAEIIFQNESKMYVQGSRNSKEFEQGTGTFTVNAASKEIKELVGTKCIYAINFFKSTSFTNTKCKVSDIALERLQLIKQ
ncbi:MAG: hypothetical protein CM15mP124_4180 [Alphaproteobacteria bacterium]|nr:MAG: hypothetical protein CM15mP124_4180 [Alphaproteobacteria bacterium]